MLEETPGNVFSAEAVTTLGVGVSVKLALGLLASISADFASEWNKSGTKGYHVVN